MNQTEIFKLCENSAKHQCHDCNAFSEFGITYCSCERNLKYSRSPTTLQKTNCDVTSITGFVIKKNSSRGPKHGVSERQVTYYRAKQMPKKARKAKTRKPSDDTFKVLRTRRIPRFVSKAQYWRKRNHALRSHRS